MTNPTDNIEQGIDDALSTSSSGRWLFKNRDLLMGPVAASVIIDKLYAGEIGPRTPVANEDDDEKWMPLRDVSIFSVHVVKSQAKQRVQVEKKAYESRSRRKKALRMITMIGASVLLVAVVFGAVAWFVASKPWYEEEASLADLQITVNPPTIALASARDLERGEEIYLDVHVEKEPEPTTRTTRRVRPRRPAATAAKRSTASTKTQPSSADSKVVTTSDADGLGTTRSYDMDHIRAVLNRQSQSLFPCIRKEVGRSGFSGTIPFSFVINNNGRVGRLWIDERRLRAGEMQNCFERTMAGWRFNSFEGERPTVSHSFTIGSR